MHDLQPVASRRVPAADPHGPVLIEYFIDASAGTGPRVFIDSECGLNPVVRSLRSVRSKTVGAVIAIIGVVPDRDVSTASQLGKVAADEADLVVVTDIHPDFTDSAPIRAALLAGARSANPCLQPIASTEPTAAIRLALHLSDETDSIYFPGALGAEWRDRGDQDDPISAIEDTKAALVEFQYAERGRPSREDPPRSGR